LIKKTVKAYDKAANEHHGEFAYLNFPDKKQKGLRELIIKAAHYVGYE
jgi:hypothetical protein